MQFVVTTICTLMAICSLAWAGPLPKRASIDFDVYYGGGLKIGKASQRWVIEGERYRLDTMLIPILGPTIHYVSEGRLAKEGLIPSRFEERRGKSDDLRNFCEFDWKILVAKFGEPDNPQSGELEKGAQDINAFPYQLSYVGDGTGMQIATGKKLRHDTFGKAGTAKLKIDSNELSLVVLRSADGDSRSEVWLSPAHHNLPLKLSRAEGNNTIEFVARHVEIEPTERKE
ncbi:DUF3108 domain-containing protein [Parachitinimonas caeni]|uniref:DUF3108 domain-containing protein n=1 Tax=Parachitinimonas caeni TaxID=3031301 RepID=A0ABT7DVF6_9NEIS|nr:DUF3108 domain-containing protein [Parachitinimonas caeni]MDK2123130.1 DUF3108 domain-containing protein [Parachitinimonas caeni]